MKAPTRSSGRPRHARRYRRGEPRCWVHARRSDRARARRRSAWSRRTGPLSSEKAAQTFVEQIRPPLIFTFGSDVWVGAWSRAGPGWLRGAVDAPFLLFRAGVGRERACSRCVAVFGEWRRRALAVRGVPWRVTRGVAGGFWAAVPWQCGGRFLPGLRSRRRGCASCGRRAGLR
jgi:hypothetical protein